MANKREKSAAVALAAQKLAGPNLSEPPNRSSPAFGVRSPLLTPENRHVAAERGSPAEGSPIRCELLIGLHSPQGVRIRLRGAGFTVRRS
jgi:hypothetical protein